MTREEAIIILTNTASLLRDGTRYMKPEHEKQFREAYEMAIKSLEEQRWNPVTERLPSAQEKPFNLPEIYIAEGYDTIEGEDGNVGFGVYVPDETKIYVAGDVEGEIRARVLFHEVCHWVQAMCGRPFDEDEANEFSDIVYDALPSAQPEIKNPCSEC